MKRVQHELRKLCVLSLVLIVGHLGLFCRFWGHFGAILAGFGVISGVWGSFQGLFCLLRCHFSQFWGHFRGLVAILACFGDMTGQFWPVLGVLGSFWPVLGPYRGHFGQFRSHFGALVVISGPFRPV